MEAQEQKQTKKQRKKQNKERQATGCFLLTAVVILLLSALVIFRVLSGSSLQGKPSRLTENPYGPEDFTTRDGYVTCAAGPTRRGIDVSEHQGTIDWQQVKDAGFDFAFIRIGYRGYSVGDIFPDDLARQNLAGAKEVGLQVGAYFYAQAISAEEAAEEAQWCLDFLQGESLELPLVYDWEYVSPSARTGGMDKSTLTQCVQTFCETVSQAGYQPMVYFNSHISRDLLELEAIAQYPFWLAQYKDQMDYPWRVEFWQYTETGSVPGIKGDVDIDLMFLY